MNSNAPARSPLPQVTLAQILKQPAYAERFQQVLGERAPQFISSLLSVASTMRDVEPQSIVAAAMIAATLNLPIDKNLGFAWIVPYRRDDRKFAQFQMGYKGIIQLALRSAAYSRMNAMLINAEAYRGRDEVGEPVIDWELVDETKPPAGCAFAFKLTNGFTKVCYWPISKIEDHAKRYSQSYRSGKDSPWMTHKPQMFLKTVVANELRKWGILSVELQRAFQEDDGLRERPDAEIMYPESLPPPSPKFEGPESPPQSAAQQDDPEDMKPQPKRGRPKKPEPASAAEQPPAESPQEEPAVPAQTQETQAPEKAAQADELEDMSGMVLIVRLQKLMRSSNVSEEQLTAWAKKNKYAKEDQDLTQLAEHKLRTFIRNWEKIAPDASTITV